MNKLFLFLLLFVLSSSRVLSQDFAPSKENAFFYTPQNVGFATPQTADFQKYGNLNINHYNGLLNMEIPLEGYSDNDFDLPISLQYVSEGFRPSKRPSLVGYNWILNVGGIITRTVYGSPDDVKGNISDNRLEHMPQGYLVGDRIQGSSPSNETLWSFSTSAVNYKDRDLEHDIFHFNFGKHKGSFIIKNAQAVLLDGGGYKIDISNMSSQNFSYTSAPSSSTITIYTPDGFKYEFGGVSAYLEYSIPNNPDKVKKRPVHIISWYLNKITAPSNRTAIFTYISVEQKNKYDYLVNNVVSQTTTITRTSPGTYSQSTGPNVNDNNTIKIVDRVFVPFLNKIQIGTASINFSRDMYSTSFYSTETSSDLYRLTEILYKYGTQEIRKEHFSYTQKGRYFFLSSLSLNYQAANDQIYTFDYNWDKTLPDPQTISTDHWGFWNGGTSTSESASTYLNNIDTRKAVDTSVYSIGLLKKVTYPARGSTEIIYEHNRYHHYKERNMTTIKLDDKSSTTAIACGGARVQTIKDYDPVSGKYCNVKKYQYKKPNGTQESGVTSLLPKYKTADRIAGYMVYSEIIWQGSQSYNVSCRKELTRTYNTSSCNTIGYNNNMEYHIGYSDVTEVLDDGSYTHYSFSSWLDVPDDVDINNSYNRLDLGWVGYFISSRQLTGPAYLEKFGLYKTNDMSKFRGKLLNKKLYSSSGNIVQREDYGYNTANAKNSYLVSITREIGGLGANKIYISPCNLIRKEVVNSSVSNVAEYTYNSHNFISEINYKDSYNNRFRKVYKYISEYDISGTNANYRTIIKGMIDKNMIGYLSEEQTHKVENSSWGAIDGKLIKYANFGSFYKPEAEYILQNNGLLMNVALSQLSSSGALNLHSSYAIRTEYHNYDSYGNPVYISKDGTNKVAYLWSYEGRYPVAEIKNAAYSQVSNILTTTLINRVAVSSTPTTDDLNSIKNLRTNNNLPEAHVSVYEYKPLYGISKVTDNRGIVSEYEYDTSVRLAKTKRNNNPVEEYIYNYKTQ